MRKIEITFEIDGSRLQSYEDSYLATLWHIAQANPADHGDKQAGELTERVGREIIRRWLASTPPELWRHQGKVHYWKQLTRFAMYTPPADVDAWSPDWHRGTWSLRPEAIEAYQETNTDEQEGR